MKIRLDTLKKIIKETLEERNLLEVDRQRLAGMYRQLGERLKKINPNTSPAEHEEMRREIQNIASIDMGMGERLMAFYQQKKQAAETAWDHVPQRSSGGIFRRAPAHMPSDKRPKRSA